MTRQISYGRQSVSTRDILAVSKVLRSDALTQGPEIPKFELALSLAVNSRSAVAFNSATSALHAACHALGVGEGDIVWTSAVSFVASANCAIYCGAEVDFIDINPKTGNMSVENLRFKLFEAEIKGQLPKVVIPVHFAGQPCDLREISDLSDRFGFKVIEDASHALGANYSGEPIGNSKFSDITVFSFHPVKMLTTGEGGMCMTGDPDIAEKLIQFRSHGITRDPEKSLASIDGPWSYDQIGLGYNYRLTDIQAALGISQLKRLGRFIARRNEIATLYRELLEGGSWLPLEIEEGRTSSNHIFVVQNRSGGEARKVAYTNLTNQRVIGNVHYRPIYRNSFYAKMGKYDPHNYPGAEEYYQSALSIPIYFGLRNRDVRAIARTLRNQVS
jgi:UDP-4-amino-4,6-dideoxy-N-acetyl-beta-L-altrosamine transaminase